jgi:hypothetical protein
MDSEGSLLRSQVPLNCPYSQPHQYRPFRILPNYYVNIHFDSFLPSTPRSFKRLFAWGPPPKRFVHLSCLPYVPNTPSISFTWFTWWWGVQSIKIVVIQSSPLPFHLVTLRPKYLLQHSILKHASQYERPTFTPTQNNRKDYISVCGNLYIFG